LKTRKRKVPRNEAAQLGDAAKNGSKAEAGDGKPKQARPKKAKAR
jgi:hypothetical protein